MTELLSALDQLRSEELAPLPDARLEEDFAELQRAGEMLEAERLRRLAEIERRGTFQRDGHLSAASWLATSFKVGWGQAKDQVRTARGLEEMPETKKALDAGELSLSAAKVLVAAREADPDAFSRCERTLVEAARTHQVRDLQRVTTQWRQMVERDRGDGEDELRAMRGMYVSRTFRGMVRVDGDLDPESGESLMRRSGRSWTPSRAREPTIPAPPRSDAPTRSPRCAGSGWIIPVARASAANAPT